MIQRSGASDAAAVLLLVPGATLQDGKYAVIRGLPDRYVSSQMNGVRLPSADEDKRAVELDPGMDAAWMALGFVYETRQEPEEALTVYRQAVQANPGVVQGWAVWTNEGGDDSKGVCGREAHARMLAMNLRCIVYLI